MKRFYRLMMFCCLLGSTQAWSEETGLVADAKTDAKLEQMWVDGAALIQNKNIDDGVGKLTQVVAAYEKKYSDKSMAYFSARTPTETLFYLLQAANKKQSAQVVTPSWSYAYYLLGYAMVEKGDWQQAKNFLNQALKLSPSNSQFLAEMGHLYQLEKNWPKALKLYQQAQSTALEFSPKETKNYDISRALRGQGYVLIEQNKLDEAIALYKECLAIDANDQMALSELKYIEGLKSKQK